MLRMSKAMDRSHVTYQAVAQSSDASKKLPGRLLFYHEIPNWQQENECLLSGYRPTADSTYDCFLSSFRWHNESVNILSHIAGSIIFAALPGHFYSFVYVRSPNALPQDFVLFTTYFIGVSICFACSASCHIVWNHSPSVASFGNQLDYLGIVLLMWTASLPSIYYGLICDRKAQTFHWVLTSTLAMGCIMFTLSPRFCTPQFRSYRAALYTGLGLAALLFVSHGLLLHGYSVQEKRMSLSWMLKMALFNLFGAAAYALRIPEKIFPYKFDFIGASHQIFHIMVIVAGITHYIGLVCSFNEIRRVEDYC